MYINFLQIRKSEDEKKINLSVENYKSYTQEFESLVKEHNKLTEQAERIMGNKNGSLHSSFDNLQACTLNMM